MAHLSICSSQDDTMANYPNCDCGEEAASEKGKAMEDTNEKCLPNGVMFDAFGRERVRYVRVTLDGAHLILHPNELEGWKADEPDQDQFTYTDVYLSPEEADALPEFDGF